MLALTILCACAWLCGTTAVQGPGSGRHSQPGTPSPITPGRAQSWAAHTVFKTLGEACDFIFKPRFLRVASAQSWLLIVQPVFVLNPLTKARLASLVAGSACDWRTVFTSVPHCVLISPARVQASTCHSLLDPRTDREAGLSPMGPVFLDCAALCYHDGRAVLPLRRSPPRPPWFLLFSDEPLLALFQMRSAPRAGRPGAWSVEPPFPPGRTCDAHRS
uniref:Uncharacterized protein n=1 Tax=Myotis myotis TaxID=51298 RepID=A0A7J7SCJ0_MYOMY|nr:hypothetical protein mMyoMyo1_009504 [Myotis myotis]